MEIEDYVEIIKKNILTYLEKFGWSRNELSNRAQSLSQSAISEWYKKESVVPSLKNLLEVCEVFGISLGRLTARNDIEDLEAREQELIEYFVRFSPEEQDSILQTFRVLTKNKSV